MRRLLTAVSALAIGVLASGVARADQCKPIHAMITTSVTGCLPGESPIGFCTAGNIDSGLLAGSTHFGVQSMTPTPSGDILYTGVLTVTTRSGTVTIKDYGILTDGLYSEMQQVVSGTGHFKHITGMLVSQGSLLGGTFTGRLVGTLCHFNRGHDDG